MRIFVVEYITGGGLIGKDLGNRLLTEAEIMVNALLKDLSELPGIRVLVSRDPRLPRPDFDCEVFIPKSDGDVWKAWGCCIEDCDAVWPLMPESEGLLERISTMALEYGCRLIGSHPRAVAVSSSKLLTAKLLGKHAINVVPTFDANGDIPFIRGRWVLKPDDGVACEGVTLFDDYLSLRQVLQDGAGCSGYVAQPYIQGYHASLSMLFAYGSGILLAANAQKFVQDKNRYRVDGVVVNAIPDARALFSVLANSVASAMPGLWGYAGIDLVIAERGPVVMEVNPRLTLSYAGLKAALGINTASLVVRMLSTGTLPACVPVATSSCVTVPSGVPDAA